MKKRFFNGFLYLMMIMLGMSSCVKDGDLSGSRQETQEEKFENDFNLTFGVSNLDYANHTWGINTVPMIVKSNGSMRAASTNGNQWEDNGYEIPTDITADELEKVLAVFNQKGEAEYRSLVDWDTYFVQQVYKGDAVYKNHDGQDVIGAEHMDWLCTVTNKKVEVVSWWPYQEKIVTVDPYDDHINDFNNGSATGEWVSEKTDKSIKEMMLMTNTNSDKFGFKSSEDNGHVFYNFRMEKIDGNYYVGFDFEANGTNPNEQVDRDYIYNDWIVKIVPGTGVTPNVERVRIMCEDLGSATSDFDYNDIVFDILFVKDGNNLVADIVLLAAGGTLRLTIGGKEVHELFKVGVKEMVNTGAGPEKDPVSFQVTLPRNDYATAWDAINDLPIVVYYSSGQKIQLTTNPGKPAEMIAVTYGTKWSPERVSIYNTYPSFVDWIKDPSVKWWEVK